MLATIKEREQVLIIVYVFTITTNQTCERGYVTSGNMAADLRLQFQALQEQKKQKLLKRNDSQRKNATKNQLSKEEMKSKQNEFMVSMYDEINDDLDLFVSLYHRGLPDWKLICACNILAAH